MQIVLQFLFHYRKFCIFVVNLRIYRIDYHSAIRNLYSRMKKITLLLVALFAALATVAAPTELTYSHAQADKSTYFWGNQKKEVYNIAIGLHNPAFIGATISAINVPVRPSAEIESISAWLTTELKIELVDGVNTNIPNIGSYAVTLPTECEPGLDYAYAKVTLPEPVTVPAEGLYVGYTLTLKAMTTDEAKSPIVVGEGAGEDGLYAFTSRTYRLWFDISEQLDAVSAISVDLSVDIPNEGVGVYSIEDANVIKGNATQTTMRIANVGKSEIKSLHYTVDVSGAKGEGTIDLASAPVPATWGATAYVDIDVPVVNVDGYNEGVVTIDKVNGIDNTATTKSGKLVVNVMPFEPVFRPLVEEYTGTGCGNCPRGYVAMEYMGEKYPTDYMGVAWHTYTDDDPMYADCSPMQAGSYPIEYIDRTTKCDPYIGDITSSGFGIEDLWNSLRSASTPIGIDVTAYLSEDENTVHARAKATWARMPEDPNAEYRIEFILIADGLESDDPSWRQNNYYNSKEYEGTFLIEKFVGLGNYVFLTYNDVGIADSGVGGIAGSMSADIKINQPDVVDYAFDITELRQRLPLLLDKLRVIAAVVMQTDNPVGKPINCNRTDVGDWASVDKPEIDSSPVSTVYYDISGRQIAGKPQGLVIRIDRLSDGRTCTTKQIVK